MKPKRAIISVYDKEGIVELAKAFVVHKIEIIATGKTAALLKSEKISVTEVSDYTGSPEILGGRVKTLHPKIAGGILSYRKEKNIEPIDIVVCNLYPFEESLKKSLTLEQMVEMVDIGGVTLLRAGAKNYEYVAVIPDKKFYPMIKSELKEKGEISLETRKLLALKSFEIVSHYDSVIQEYFYNQFQSVNFSEYYTKTYIKSLPLRYGENPHQKAFYYSDPFSSFSMKQIQGKELSYNNLMDLEAVISLTSDFPRITCAIVKHNTPCGVAISNNIKDAYLKAFNTDDQSAFGGIVGFNSEVDEETAKEIVKVFLEVIVAHKFSAQALAVLKSKKNLRVVEYSGETSKMLIRNCLGGILMQDKDTIQEDVKSWKVVSNHKPTDEEISDLEFAWKVAKFVKSNAIVTAKDKVTLGVGAGQMSRVDSTEIAIKKAKTSLENAVMASDGFFPFRDSIDLAVKHGIKAVVEPGGSINDKEVIEAANEHNIALVFTGIRHFRH
jgi:phosphoribosylaminoimidazolecarboxamide formyltransferase/IMP cyclohydrolase